MIPLIHSFQAGDKRSAAEMTHPEDGKKKLLMSGKVLLGVLRNIPRRTYANANGVKKLDLLDVQKVCKEWKEAIDVNADLLPRVRLDRLSITTVSPSRNLWEYIQHDFRARPSARTPGRSNVTAPAELLSR